MTYSVDGRRPQAEHLPGRDSRPEPRVEALRLLRTVLLGWDHIALTGEDYPGKQIDRPRQAVSRAMTPPLRIAPYFFRFVSEPPMRPVVRSVPKVEVERRPLKTYAAIAAGAR